MESCMKSQNVKGCRKYTVGRDSVVGIATRYRLQRSGDRIPVGPRFSASFHTGPGTLPMGIGSFSGVRRLRLGIDYPPHQAPRLKKEYSYTSTSSLGLRSLF
jgi:hypothetical protein